MTDWPVLKRYDADHLSRIAMPVGGIGTGCVALGGRGDLRNWELVNRPALRFRPERIFLAVSVGDAGGGARTARVLEGPLDPAEYEGVDGSRAANHGLPRFRRAEFRAAYPFGRVELSDPGVPLEAAVEAFNPLIPGDSDASGLPVAIVRVRLRNPTERTLSAGVCWSMTNFLGTDGTDRIASKNSTIFRREGSLAGLWMTSDVPADSPLFGTLAVVTHDAERDDITARPVWPAGEWWNNDLLEVWDDLSDDGRLDDRPPASAPATPTGSLAVTRTLPPGASEAVTFVLAWHFPNRQSWTPHGRERYHAGGRCESGPPTIGNHYTTRFPDAWAAAAHASERVADLEEKTAAFVRTFCESDLPAPVKEAALFNLSTLKTQTCFRTPDGRFFGWEGVFEAQGSCHGSCTHVWNYEQATALLFGDLARSMRDTEFRHMTRSDGRMSFRANLPLEHAADYELAAADGQAGCLVKLYRDWQLCGDDEWLAALWPGAKAALRYFWLAGGWDGDRDGVVEGCQHNTMDVEYYGPNPQMQVWYLAALRAGEEMARRLGDDDLAGTCRRLFAQGREWTDANLFNGEYYEHHVTPAPAIVAAGTRRDPVRAAEDPDPPLQLGSGCLVDQLVGQLLADLCGLGPLVSPQNVRTTLRSIERFNRIDGAWGHFNPLRSFVLGDESALVMASYPRGGRPRQPFPYYAEAMTGFEYAAAGGMVYAGLRDEGVAVVAAIRDRYDGRRRNPFDESECGRHYARAMASWALVPAWTGFRYSAPAASMAFAAAAGPVTWFWSNGRAWGALRQRPVGAGVEVKLSVLHGTLRLREFSLDGVGAIRWAKDVALTAGRPLNAVVPAA